jgi:TatD DNase family protein
MKYVDAHLHLQADGLFERVGEVMALCAEIGIERMVVNGTRESDWERVAELAREYPGRVLPSFGLHPWYVNEASADWRDRLVGYLDAMPSGVGEVGLDRWIQDFDLEKQEEAFRFQIRLAAERGRPLSIHCLKAWGRMLEVLEGEPLPECGFLLHSYGGAVELVPDFARLGGYFSFSGYYLEERKAERREVLKAIPSERVLIETDAPEMPLPEGRARYSLEGKGNHPGNLVVVYEEAAKILGESQEGFSLRVGENFRQMFGVLRERED